MAGRKRKHGPIILSILAVTALVLFLILWNFVFVIRDVQVVGNGNIPAEDVIRLSKIQMGARLNTIDKPLMKNNLESDGRIALVSIETQYPNRVILNVRPRSRDAMALQANKMLILDSDGYVVEIMDYLPQESLPHVTGLQIASYQLGHQIDADDDRIAGMKAVVEAIISRNAGLYVSEIDVSHPLDLRITTRTGMTVLLGDRENMQNKILWMAGAVQDLEARGQGYGTLDVSSGTKADYSEKQR